MGLNGRSRLPGSLLLFYIRFPPSTLPGLHPHWLTATNSPAFPLGFRKSAPAGAAAPAAAPTPSRKRLQQAPADRGDSRCEKSLAHDCFVQCEDEVRVGRGGGHAVLHQIGHDEGLMRGRRRRNRRLKCGGRCKLTGSTSQASAWERHLGAPIPRPPECSPTSPPGTCGKTQARPPLPLTSLGEPCRTTQHCAYNGRRDRSAPSMRFSRSETGVPRDGSTDREREGSMAWGSPPKTCGRKSVNSCVHSLAWGRGEQVWQRWS